MESIQDQLKRIDNSDAGKPRKSVMVLGAGMAGLCAAHELLRLGHSVKIIEGNTRIGGRVWTKRFSDGQYHELGAMRIPAGHDYTRHYISVAGLDGSLRRFITSHDNANCFYHLRGGVERIRNAAATLLQQYQINAAERALVNSAVAPAIFGVQLANVISGLSNADVDALFGHGPLTSKVAYLDRLSLGDFLEQTVSGADAKELVGVTTGLEVWWDKALTMFLRDEITGTSVGLQEIAGGTDLLPTNLSKIYCEPHIQCNTEVVAIHRTKKGATVWTQPSDKPEPPESHEVDHLICTIPFSVLRCMDLSGFSARKMRAIRNLNYADSTKVLLHCSKRFWEMGGPNDRIIGGASFSDQITRATYYPSDHAPPVDALLGDQQRRELGARGSYTAFGALDQTQLTPVQENSGAGVLVGSYNWGRDARRLGAQGESERMETVISVVEKFHPTLRNYVDDSASISWGSYPWSRGAFCFMSPEDLRLYYQDSIKSEGTVYFAGEHCSLDQGWIQGAIISGLRSIEEIVSSR